MAIDDKQGQPDTGGVADVAPQVHRAVAEDAPTADELVGLLRQERADFRNYRQRVMNERSADLERMRADVLEPILPLFDDLDRALAELPERLADDPWVRGIGLTRSRLGEVERRLGIERIGSTGEPFDAERHEALIYEPDADASSATLEQVLRPGYVVAGRLIRPAQVVVRGPLLDRDDTDNSDQRDQRPTANDGDKASRDGDMNGG
jgi:molecular chaperone GrpE